jgi:hypothetical protein
MMWNSNDKGPMIEMYDGEGELIDWFSDHLALKETTSAYHAATAKLQADPSDENRQEQKKCLEAYHVAARASMASPTYSTYNRIAVGTAKGQHGNYFVGPKNKFGAVDTMLTCVVTIGDHHSKTIGGRSNWDVRRIPISSIPQGNRMIFVASDGVHDCYTEEELAKEVMMTESDVELLGKFVTKSKKMFQTKKVGFGIVQADDISFFRGRF